MGEQKNVEIKKNEGEKKSDGGVTTVLLKVDMHCEGCAKKIRRSVKHFDGVDSVKTDCGSNKLTVVGKVNPTKVKERVEEKIKKKVDLISPQPNKASKEGGDKKGDEKKSERKPNEKKSDEKKDKPKEPQLSTIVLKTRVHCEGCAQKIRRIVGKYEGVHDVNVDLQKDTIITKGTMNMKDLLPYLRLKLKRSVEVVQPKKDEGGGDKKGQEGGGGGGQAPEKPKEGGGGSGGSEKKSKEGGGDKKEGGGEKKEGGGEKTETGGDGGGAGENMPRMEVSKMEYGGYPYVPGYGYGYNHIYDPRHHGEGSYNHQVTQYWHEPVYNHPPQMFSDENPNACSVM